MSGIKNADIGRNMVYGVRCVQDTVGPYIRLK